MRLDLLKKLNFERSNRRAAVLVTDLATGDQRLATEADMHKDALSEQLDAALRQGKSATIEVDGKALFLTVQAPAPRVIAVGAAHITQALAPIARLVGFDTTVVDPRTAFATAERFPDVNLVAEWPDVALARIGLDRFTAVACFTHDPKIDDPALEQALRAECFYVGALGSRKTHARRLERLAAAGFSPEQTARIKAPIGLDIGSVSPSEIAVAVMAEIILALRKKPLRSERGPA